MCFSSVDFVGVVCNCSLIEGFFDPTDIDTDNYTNNLSSYTISYPLQSIRRIKSPKPMMVASLANEALRALCER